MKTQQEKIVFEQKVVARMIGMYCRKSHQSSALCSECSQLLVYAEQRSAACPYRKAKLFCSNCEAHCYEPNMRERIRRVMRYAGPRMLLHHPILAIKHVVESNRDKRMQKNKG